MAVTVTDTRTTASDADSTTGWVGSSTPTLFTTDPDPVEATGSLGMVVSTATQNIYFTIASVDLTNTLVYVWVFPRGAMDTTVNGGQALQIGDGTDRIGFHLAGSDVAAFRHEAGPVGWQCLMLDTGNLPAAATAYAGAVGSLTLTAVTQLGAGFKTLAKSVGGVSNCFTDVIRYGNGGLRITAGTSGDTGKFSEIAADDRSTVSGKGYGIIRQLGSGLFGVQGPLTFGDTAGTTATFFADTSASVVFEDRGVRGGRYFITVQGNATGSTTFRLGTKSGTGDAMTGVNGCTIVMPVLTGGLFTASDADLQFCLIYGSILQGIRGGLTFSSNATNGPNHEFAGNSVVDCGQMDPGRIVVRNCNFTSFVGPSTGAAASVSSQAEVVHEAHVALQGTAVVTAVGTLSRIEYAELVGTATVTASGTVLKSASATLTGVATVTATAQVSRKYVFKSRYFNEDVILDRAARQWKVINFTGEIQPQHTDEEAVATRLGVIQRFCASPLCNSIFALWERNDLINTLSAEEVALRDELLSRLYQISPIAPLAGGGMSVESVIGDFSFAHAAEMATRQINILGQIYDFEEPVAGLQVFSVSTPSGERFDQTVVESSEELNRLENVTEFIQPKPGGRLVKV